MSAVFSPFYKSQGLIFISGQVGSGQDGIIPKDFASQVRNTLENLQSVVFEADSTLDKIVKTTVYLTDLSLYSQFNEIYGNFFHEHKPARTTVGVAVLPAFEGDPTILIEIEAIAVV